MLSFLIVLAFCLCICSRADARKTVPTNTPTWPPLNVDAIVPAAKANVPCSLPQVLTRTGRRVQQLVSNLNRFTALETVRHQKVDAHGNEHAPEFRRFDYLVILSQRPSGYMNVDEYRNAPGRGQPDVPDHVATEGTPILVLVFHPKYAANFSMACEGLSVWDGKPAWQVHFEERDPRRSIIGLNMGGRAFSLRICGRAWILADSYQIAHMETDLVDTIPAIRLHLDHQSGLQARAFSP